MLVSIAQWQLFLAREFVIDNPLPWQPAQEELTPERVQQGLGGLFQQIGPHPKLAESRQAGPKDGHGPAESAIRWSKRPRARPKLPEIGAKLGF